AGRIAAGRPYENLVDWQRQPLTLLPGDIFAALGARDGFEERVARQVGLEGELIPAVDPDLPVFVPARHLPHEQIDRPPARHEPGVRKALHLARHRLDLFQGTDLRFSHLLLVYDGPGPEGPKVL